MGFSLIFISQKVWASRIFEVQRGALKNSGGKFHFASRPPPSVCERSLRWWRVQWGIVSHSKLLFLCMCVYIWGRCPTCFEMKVAVAESKTTAGHTRDISVADLRKRALSAVCGGALQWRKISILVDPPKISVVSKKKKKKKGSLVQRFIRHWGPLAIVTFWGFGWGPWERGGPGQQLLTLADS